MRVIPRNIALEKLAALEGADAYGRRLAQDHSVEKLASATGAWMAGVQDDAGLMKVAQEVVRDGELTEEEYEMLKEARLKPVKNFVGRLIKKLKTVARGPSRDVGAAAAQTGKPQMSGATYNKKSSRRAMPKAEPAPGAVVPKSAPAKSPATWRRALPYMGVGAAGYGLYKGVPWAMRNLEAASTTPMASGAGWSPVSYGYGHTPYGPGTPSMGGGA